MAKNSIQAIALQDVNSNLFGVGPYAELTPLGGLGHPCFYIRILNDSNQDIYVSYDGGVTNNDIVLQAEELILSFQNQAQPNNYTCLFPSNFKVWVESVSGNAGNGFVYLSAYYQPN
jgi:hypothetical protein